MVVYLTEIFVFVVIRIQIEILLTFTLVCFNNVNKLVLLIRA